MNRTRPLLVPPAAMRFEGLQGLRLVAAFMVVLTHATFFISTRLTDAHGVWEGGAQGVNIFFVISGFVMYLSAQPLIGRTDAFGTFALARIIRIVPLYWALNVLKIAQILAIPSLALANPTWNNIVLSMLFIPSRNADGLIETFYGVGWTLNFEMFFYLLVGLALWWRISILGLVTPVLLAFAALSLVRTDDWPAVTYLFQPIVLNFLWGALLAALHLRGFSAHPALALALIVGGSAIILAWPGANLFQLQYAALVAGVVWLEPRLNGRMPAWLLYGGDASYSLYLVHPMASVVVAVILSRLGVQSFPLAMAAIVLACLAASAFTYQYFERPVTQALRRRFLTRPGPAPARPASAEPGA